MSALARSGSPEDDIAPVALFLASKDSQFITGYSRRSGLRPAVQRSATLATEQTQKFGKPSSQPAD